MAFAFTCIKPYQERYHLYQILKNINGLFASWFISRKIKAKLSEYLNASSKALRIKTIHSKSYLLTSPYLLYF